MSRKHVLLAFLSFFVIAALISQTTSSQSFANRKRSIPQSGTVYYPNASINRTLAETVHNLDTGLNYTTIQEAIDAPETLDGHTILVDEGIYHEDVVVHKSVSLVGQDNSATIIDGTGTTIRVLADDVVISNFNITSNFTGLQIGDPPFEAANRVTIVNNIINDCTYEGIRTMGSHNVVKQNKITSTTTAISARDYFAYSLNNTISQNIIANNSLGIDLRAHNYSVTENVVKFNEKGMNIFGGNNNVTYNIVNSNFFGMHVGSGSMFRENQMSDNEFGFMCLREASGTTYFGNLGASRFINDIDTSNKINGNSIYYLIGQTNLLIDSSTDPNVGYLALVNCSKITVKDLTLTNNCEGLLIVDSTHITIERCNLKNNMIGIQARVNKTKMYNNDVSDNYHGISVTGYQNTLENNTIRNNTLQSLPYRWHQKWPSWLTYPYLSGWISEVLPFYSGGVFLQSAHNCTVTGNDITSNEHGVLLRASSFNTFKDNSMANNIHNFGFDSQVLVPRQWGRSPPVSAQVSPFLTQDIDTSNTVDGKPVYYWIGRCHQTVPADAGYVVLVNCTDIVVKNLEIRNGVQGVLLISVNNTIISNNTISRFKYGIDVRSQDYLFQSANNTVIGNHLANSGIGVCLRSATNNVRGNLLTCNLFGILSEDCNLIEGNIAENNTQPPIEEWTLGHYPPYYNMEIHRYFIVPGFRAHGCGGLAVVGSGNLIIGNSLTGNDCGLVLYRYPGGANTNAIYNNCFMENTYGIWLAAENNAIVHNNFIGNTYHAYIDPALERRVPPDAFQNIWDNGMEGNHWSGFNVTDSNSDGIGDHQYSATPVFLNTDNYPLMGMFSSFNTSLGKNVNVISNSTIEGFEYFEFNSTMKMYVSNMTGNQTYGFCRVCIPHALMDENNISVEIDDGATAVLHADYNICDNGTHRWIYFTYEHSTHKIDIIPEFSSLLILSLFMVASLLAVIVCKRKRTF